MDENKRKTIALSFALMIPRGSVVPKGRLKSLMERLEKRADRELKLTYPLGLNEVEGLRAKVLELQEAVGWTGKHKHLMTAVSFALSVIDYFDFPKVVEVLNDITEYFERSGKLYPACNWAGSLAAQKWEEICNG